MRAMNVAGGTPEATCSSATLSNMLKISSLLVHSLLVLHVMNESSNATMAPLVDRVGSAGPGFAHAKEATAFTGNEQMMAIDSPETNQIDSVVPDDGHHQSWLSNVQDSWSLQSPATTLGRTFQIDGTPAGLEQWSVHGGETRPVDDPISTILSEYSTAATPIRNHIAIDSLSSEPSSGVDLNANATSQLASQASSIRSYSDHVRDLHDFLSNEPTVTKRLLEVYFADVQPCWPILHPPTFDAGEVESVLIGSMVLLATWLEGNSDHMRLASFVFEDLDKIINVGQKSTIRVMDLE
ncbi:MAG: hypothetical protein L6R38_005556 [Xanthoria sp. 2 TBL-2021]|nr:MAG: hypothetical protein L6R38_005556 [Xanthoria sp. 2 TBL-2021]